MGHVSADQPGPAASAEDISDFVEFWFAAYREGLEILHQRDLAINASQVGEGGNISLLAIDCQSRGSSGSSSSTTTAHTNSDKTPCPILIYVTWVSETMRIGRRVNLDSANGVIFSVPARIRSENFSTAEVIHPCVGVRMLKNKGMQQRPTMPTAIRRLREMWEVALASKHEGPAEGIETTLTGCCVCSRCVLGLHDTLDMPEKTCPLCLLTMHECCSQRVAKLSRLDMQKQLRPARTQAVIPALFTPCLSCLQILKCVIPAGRDMDDPFHCACMPTRTCQEPSLQADLGTCAHCAQSWRDPKQLHGCAKLVLRGTVLSVASGYGDWRSGDCALGQASMFQGENKPMS